MWEQKKNVRKLRLSNPGQGDFKLEWFVGEACVRGLAVEMEEQFFKAVHCLWKQSPVKRETLKRFVRKAFLLTSLICDTCITLVPSASAALHCTLRWWTYLLNIGMLIYFILTLVNRTSQSCCCGSALGPSLGSSRAELVSVSVWLAYCRGRMVASLGVEKVRWDFEDWDWP